MKVFLKAIPDAIVDRLAVILISATCAGIVGACNHRTISQTNQWVGQHLQDKQEQIDELKNSK